MRISKLIYFGVLVALWTVFSANSYSSEKEVRAIWATRYSLISKKSIDNLVETADKYNFNLIFAQVRGRGEAFYNSEIEPKYEKLEENFDPLSYLIEKAHEKDIEVHAWLNAYYVWSESNKPTKKNHVVNKYPDWFLVDKTGCSILDYQKEKLHKCLIEGAFLDPAKDEVKEYLEKIYLEIVTKYKIDGIHFDYIRYPKSYFGYGKEAIAKFEKQTNIDIKDFVNNINVYRGKYNNDEVKDILKKWYQFKKDQVSALVEAVSKKAKKINKKVKVTAAVISNFPKAENDYSQEWDKWLKEGWIDFAVPMTYQKNTKDLKINVEEIIKKAKNKPFVMGIGAYLLQADGIIDKIKLYKKIIEDYKELLGVSLFSYDGFKGKEEQLKKIKSAMFKEKAILPWK